ncbi:hypothetical protein AB0L40_08765, partial [Patulibacter sp. NPDC049589]
MEHQSSAPGPEVGWGVGLVGFIASALAGWFLDAGVGFVLVLLIFWGGIGALFAFLVERSTIEEHDRVDELQNTRLGTLARAPGPVAGPSVRASREDEQRRTTERESSSVRASREDGDHRPTERDTGSPDTRVAPPAVDRPAVTATQVVPSPRAYREADETQRAPRPDGPRAGRRPTAEEAARIAARREQGPVPSRDAAPAGSRPDRRTN